MARHTQKGYFEADGSYNETPDKRPRQPDPKNAEWWHSLPQEHRDIIVWYNALPGYCCASSREINMQAFVRELGILTYCPKKAEYYDIIASRLKQFKEWMATRKP
jgi:hypothetical protein